MICRLITTIRNTILRVLIFLLCIGFATTIVAADEETDRENKIKIAYLFHFAQFTEWSTKFPVFNYCVYEDTHFSDLLKEAYSEKKLNGSNIDVHSISSESTATNCQLIFFPNDTPQNLLTKISKKPILSVGIQKNFTELGGIVYLYEKDQKIRFYINNTNALESGLKISSQLLTLSKDATR